MEGLFAVVTKTLDYLQQFAAVEFLEPVTDFYVESVTGRGSGGKS